MKIGLITMDIPYTGGSEYVMYEQVKYLNEQGHDVEIYCTWFNMNDINLQEYAREMKITEFWKPFPSPVLKSTINAIMPVKLLFLCNLEVMKGCDILIAHKYLSQYIASRVKKKYRIPFIWYCHTPLKPAYGISRRQHKKILEYLFSIVKKEDQEGAYSSDFVFVNSKFNRDEMFFKAYPHFPKDKVEVLYPPFKGYFDYEPRYGKYVLCVGKILPSKNQLLVIEALNKIKEDLSCSGFRIVFVGEIQDQIYYRKIKNKIKEYGIEDLVKFTGLVTEDDIKDYYLNCAFGIYSPIKEDFGLVPLELNSAGKICLSIDEGGCKETTPDRYRFSNANELGKLLLNTVNMTVEERREEGKYLRERAKNLSVGHFTGLLERVEELTGSR